MKKYSQRLKKVEGKFHHGKKTVVKFLKSPSDSDPGDTKGIPREKEELEVGEEISLDDEEVIYVCFVREEDESPGR